MLFFFPSLLNFFGGGGGWGEGVRPRLGWNFKDTTLVYICLNG